MPRVCEFVECPTIRCKRNANRQASLSNVLKIDFKDIDWKKVRTVSHIIPECIERCDEIIKKLDMMSAR